MAKTIKKVAIIGRAFAGGKTFLTVEAELGTEYKEKGVPITAAELGLSQIDGVVPISEILNTPEAAEAIAPSIVPVNFGVPGSSFKIQAFGSGAAKKEAAFELADAAVTAGSGKIFLWVVGVSL